MLSSERPLFSRQSRPRSAAGVVAIPNMTQHSASGSADVVTTVPLVVDSSLELALKRWTRRLLTKQDFMHLHAASNAAFLLGGMALEVITNAQWLAGERMQPWYPTHGFEMAAMEAVVAVSAVTGLGLTFSNRKGPERTIFAAYGVQVLQGVMLMLWMSPFLPRAVHDCAIVDVGLGGVFIVSSIVALQQFYDGKEEILAGRNKDAASPVPGSLAEMIQEICYWFPNLPGPLLTMLAGMMLIHGGREWFDAFSAAHPEYLAASLHGTIATDLAGHCGMFAVTLRDKKLIGQGGEMAIMGLTNIASLAYLALLWVKYPWLLTHALLV